MAKTLRFRFSRGQELKYLSHLEILRVFERALRRSGLPVEYSQGFNPRMKIVFGLPISTGLTSDAEYADIVLEKDIDLSTFVETLNESMPLGLKIHEAVELKNKNNIMNEIKGARYNITMRASLTYGELEDMVSSFLSKEELTVMKKTKKGMSPVNIRPMIYSMNVIRKDTGQDVNSSGYEDGNIIELDALLSAGAQDNLRADLLMEAFMEYTELKADILSINRSALYTIRSNEWKTPFEVANG